MRVYTDHCVACKEDKVIVQMTREEANVIVMDLARICGTAQASPHMVPLYKGIARELEQVKKKEG